MDQQTKTPPTPGKGAGTAMWTRLSPQKVKLPPVELLKNKSHLWLSLAVEFYNPSYSGGWGRRVASSRPVLAIE